MSFSAEARGKNSMVGEMRIGLSAFVGLVWMLGYVRWVKGLLVTAVLVDQVHEVLGLPFGEGDQRHGQREGRSIPWPWKGAEGMEELSMRDAEGQGGEYDHGHKGPEL